MKCLKTSSQILGKFELFRKGNDVQRLHNVRFHGSYSVGEHTCNATLIAMEMCDLLHRYVGGTDNCAQSYVVLRYMLLHDMAEQYTGDIPAPTKWVSEKLAKTLQQLGNQWHEDNDMILPSMPYVYQQICKFSDGLEFALWCDDQYTNLGNKNVCEPFRKITCSMQECFGNDAPFPAHLQTIVHNILSELHIRLENMTNESK
ncbi:HD domain-containing protein [bacterium]|nr:HD domain-containing protein [bacterium]